MDGRQPASTPLLAGAEPGSWPASPGCDAGALVLHGFTGTPASVRDLARALAGTGLAVEAPLLPGHGTAIEDMVPTRWQDWSEAAEEAYCALAQRCPRVVVAGLSLGGMLACWLATRHPEIAALLVVNPLLEPPADSFLDILRGLLEEGYEVAPAIGSDVAKPGTPELSYAVSPIRSALSMFEATRPLARDLATITCPVLLVSSRQDHVVPTASGDLLQDRLGESLERLWLERSYHVATLDYEAPELESAAVSFVRRVLGLKA